MFHPSPEEDSDPCLRREQKVDLEEFAHALIGPGWREEISFKHLTDMWITCNGMNWRENISFFQRWYERMSSGTDERISDAELCVLGGCIEPTEELHQRYRRFEEKAGRGRGIVSYEDFVMIVEDRKRLDPIGLYRLAQIWNMEPQEVRSQIQAAVQKAMGAIYGDTEHA